MLVQDCLELTRLSWVDLEHLPQLLLLNSIVFPGETPKLERGGMGGGGGEGEKAFATALAASATASDISEVFRRFGAVPVIKGTRGGSM